MHSPNRNKVKEALNRRWWDTRLRIYHRKINRVKYYGTKTLAKQYAQIITDAYKPFFERLDKIITEGENFSEAGGIMQYILGNLRVVTFTPLAMKKIADILEQTFTRGARRVFTRTGQQLKVGQVKNKAPLEALARQQVTYLKEMEKDVRQTVKDTLTVGLSRGKSITEIKHDIMDKSKRITKNRAETIARSEIIKASAEGTKQSMKEAGIKKYLLLTARDNRVCQICRERERGNPYEFDSNYAPMPVKDSHANCRCTIIAEVE